MKCAQPGCGGTIVDGYCDVCGLAPVAGRFRLAVLLACCRRSAERGHDPVGHDPSRSGSSRVGAIQWRQPSDAATDRDDADVAPRRRPHPGSIGAGHRSPPGVDGPADGRRGQALLLGVRFTGRSIARRRAGTVERASARSAARRSTSTRSCSPARWSAASTRWSAASPTAAWAGSTSPTIATSTIAGSC